MKRLFFILLLASFSGAAFSQISVTPFPKQVSCEIGFTDQLEHPVVSSTCGKVKTRVSEEVFSGGCAGTLVRTFEYADDCGNRDTVQQFISLKDSEEPVLLGIPEDVVLQDSNIPKAAEVIAIDNSKKMPQVIFTEEKSDSMILRRWKATDECDNTVEAEQKIYLPVKK